jgi:hypothetical protein
LQVQLGDKLALVRDGRVVHVLATASCSLFPRLAAVRPMVAAPGPDGACELDLWGHNLEQEEDTVLARCKGESYYAPVLVCCTSLLSCWGVHLVAPWGVRWCWFPKRCRHS